MDLTAPAGKKRPPDPVVVTVGGYFHAPTGADFEQALFEPLPLGFSFWVNDTDSMGPVRDAFCNPDLNSPWTVAGTPWSTTKGRGSVIMPDNSYRATQPFFDQMKKSVCVEAIWRQQASGSVVGMRWDEVYMDPAELEFHESADALSIQVNALIYGNIGKISDFTSGNRSA
jgi:hypothetical protein